MHRPCRPDQRDGFRQVTNVIVGPIEQHGIGAGSSEFPDQAGLRRGERQFSGDRRQPDTAVWIGLRGEIPPQQRDLGIARRGEDQTFQQGGERNHGIPCGRIATKRQTLHCGRASVLLNDASLHGRSVAQPGSASVWGTGGRGFESRRSDQFLRHAVCSGHAPPRPVSADHLIGIRLRRLAWVSVVPKSTSIRCVTSLWAPRSARASTSLVPRPLNIPDAADPPAVLVARAGCSRPVVNNVSSTRLCHRKDPTVDNSQPIVPAHAVSPRG